MHFAKVPLCFEPGSRWDPDPRLFRIIQHVHFGHWGGTLGGPQLPPTHWQRSYYGTLAEWHLHVFHWSLHASCRLTVQGHETLLMLYSSRSFLSLVRLYKKSATLGFLMSHQHPYAITASMLCNLFPPSHMVLGCPQAPSSGSQPQHRETN